MQINLDPEPVIISLNTELYAHKCLIVLLQIENDSLRERLTALERFASAAEDLNKPLVKTARAGGR